MLFGGCQVHVLCSVYSALNMLNLRSLKLHIDLRLSLHTHVPTGIKELQKIEKVGIDKMYTNKSRKDSYM